MPKHRIRSKSSHSKSSSSKSSSPKPRRSGPIRTAQRPLSVDPTGPIPAAYVKAKVLHPLLYRKRVQRVEGAQAGDLVAVYGATDELLGYGIYNPRSEIAVRMLWRGADLPTDDDWQRKLERAVALRHDLLDLPNETNAYRLVHGESDGLSGLVADRLGDVVSVEAFSLGMYQRGVELAQRLARLCGTDHYVVQGSPHFSSQEGCNPAPLASEHLPPKITVQEHGTRFRVMFEGGHKTGFFCDQRDNRRGIADFCKDQSVLDLCCYTGGFAIQAARLGNASNVTGVDLDHRPLALARENANLNQVRAKFVQSDAFAYMREMIGQGRQYGVVILDPPKLIRTRHELEEGTRKHFALNRLALQLVRPGGLLLSCSCAGLLQESEFVNLIVAAARRANIDNRPEQGREIRILAKTGAAPDHPVIGSCLETEYLKAVWMVVD